MARLILFILIIAIAGCRSEKAEKCLEPYRALPFSILSNRHLSTSDPMFVFYYNSETVDRGLYLCADSTKQLIPIEDGDFYYRVFAPYMSDILFFNDSLICFKGKEEKDYFWGIKYIWQYESLPILDSLPEDFDNIIYCTDRYYKQFLTIAIPEDQAKQAKEICHFSPNKMNQQWRHFFETRETATRNLLTAFQDEKVELPSEIFVRTINLTHNNQPAVALDTTVSYIIMDSLYILKSPKNRKEFLFSKSQVMKLIDYPFFEKGLNCYAVELKSDVSLAAVSNRVYQRDNGSIYEVPDTFNQRIFNVVMEQDTLGHGYSLSVRLDTEIKDRIQSLPIQKSRNDAETSSRWNIDSIFLQGNRLIKEWLDFNQNNGDVE